MEAIVDNSELLQYNREELYSLLVVVVVVVVLVLHDALELVWQNECEGPSMLIEVAEWNLNKILDISSLI